MRRVIIAAILLGGVLSFGIAGAVETTLVVRAKSKDAKFIGTKMGGALVVVKDSVTGSVLATGLTEGSTGDTGKIMKEPRTRFGRITDASTAKFETSINIDEPRLITIEVQAPYLHRDNMITSSTEIWLIPGEYIAGEGIIIEIPGFSVNVTTPERVELADNKAVIPIRAVIVMI